MAVQSEPLGAQIPEELVGQRPASLWRDTLGSILRQRSAVAGLILLGILILAAVFAGQLSAYDPLQSMIGIESPVHGQLTRLGPCIHLLGCAASQPEHILGLDGNARDLWSRILYGARVSLQIGFLTVGFAIIIGTLIGSIAGYAGGWADNIMMRIMDVLLAFPALVLAILIVTVVGTGLLQAQFAIGIVAIPVYARVMRASVLSIKERDFVTASRALGESSAGILFRRIMPNALTPLIVQGTLGIAGAVLDVAALSFLGLGAQPPTAEWGSMIGQERAAVFSAPQLIFAPGIAIVITVLGLNLLGDGLRDALDPRLNR
jgi:peptide/nickel transport system permease protein